MTAAGDQHEIIAFLERPATYGHEIAHVDRLDTHISAIFLAGTRAYKLKRAVAFSYLDFSQVALREQACRREVELNRRTAPELYLGVRAIARAADGSLAFDGPGEVLDWVVVMHRFDQDQLFDRLAARGELNAPLMEALSAEIARFHAAAEPTPAFGGAAGLGLEIDGNDENLQLAAPALPAQARERLVTRWRTELARCADLLDARRAKGTVRRVHGDLHLRNIYRNAGRPTLFDGIEFSDRLSCIDVLYDLAFLLMDLDHRRLGGFANLVFNAYLDRSDEVDGIAALPLMMSLRAGIRAHTSVAAAATQTDPAQRTQSLDDARAYCALAERLVRDAPARLIAIGGYSGSGKSTLARALAPEFGRAPGARLLHTDAIRKALFGVSTTTRLGPDAYRSKISAQVYDMLNDSAARALRAGRSAIVDATFVDERSRSAIAATARACGVPLVGLWLDAPPARLRERVAGRRTDMSDATVAVLESQLRHFAGPSDWIHVDAGAAPAVTLAQAQRLVAD